VSIVYIRQDGISRALDVHFYAFHIHSLSCYFNKHKATVNPRRFGGMLKKQAIREKVAG